MSKPSPVDAPAQLVGSIEQHAHLRVLAWTFLALKGRVDLVCRLLEDFIEFFAVVFYGHALKSAVAPASEGPK